jgi:hypothetical protein
MPTFNIQLFEGRTLEEKGFVAVRRNGRANAIDMHCL